MRVQEIRITNILGIEDLTIAPGAVTIVEGRNAAGKTSVLEAIRAVLSGGHEPDLVRRGADAGEVTITLADGIEIRKRITADKSNLTVRHPQLGKISKSQRWLNEIVDNISLDPVAFLTAPAKERVRILLEALPMRLSAEQLAFLPSHLIPRDLSAHALEVIGAIGKDLYDARTGVNREARGKRATAAQLVEGLPDRSIEQPWTDVLATAQQELRDLQQSTRQRVDAIRDDASQELTDLATKREKYVADIKAGLERKIAELRAEAQRRLDDNASRGEAERQAVAVSRDARLSDEQAAYEPRLNDLTERIGQAKAKVDEEARTTQTRAFIAQLQDEAAELEGDSERLTGWLQALDRLKAALLDQLPIPGLEVREGQIFVDRIPFDRVNDAVKVRLAIEVAKLRHGDLGLIVVDGLERFDSATFEAFKVEAARSGLQIVGARVADVDLVVVAEGTRG